MSGCWYMSLCSLLACVTIWGFRPSPPPFLSACCGEEWRDPFVSYWVVCGHKKRRRGGLSCTGVGCFEVLVLRYGGVSALCVLMGCREDFPAGFLGVGSMCFWVLVGVT